MDLQYPIGKYVPEENLTEARRQQLIADIAETPANLRAAVRGLSEAQLDTPYRPGGWTVRQVVHHLPDSHVNAYVRFKFTLTESAPVIKPYREDLWAEFPDAKSAPAELSLTLLDCLHQRFVLLLRSMKPEDFQRQFTHLEYGVLTLEKYLALYAWHGKHHVAHITTLRRRMGWA